MMPTEIFKINKKMSNLYFYPSFLFNLFNLLKYTSFSKILGQKSVSQQDSSKETYYY